MKERNVVCLSMLMPTVSAGPEARQGRIYLKNLIKEAESRLKDWSYDDEQIKKLMRSANELVDDSRFWSHQSEGLAVYLSEDHFNYYRVPINLQEQLYISDKFYVKPLLPLLSLKDVLQKAYEGRVDTLFVPYDKQIWGKFHYEDQVFETHDSEQSGDDDLLYLAIVLIFRNNGNVYALDDRDIPDDAAIAAIYRY